MEEQFSSLKCFFGFNKVNVSANEVERKWGLPASLLKDFFLVYS